MKTVIIITLISASILMLALAHWFIVGSLPVGVVL